MRVRARGKSAVACVLGAALVLTGCGSDSTDTGDTATAAGEACTTERVGGKVTMAMGSQPKGLDPLVINGTPSTGGMELIQIYDTLMQYDPTSGEYSPRVAKSLESNEAFDEWTLTLRPDVKFGNGDPLTADAVKSSLERFQGEQNKGVYRNLALQITKMEVVDPTTLVFTLGTPWAGFPFMLANTPGMIVNTAVATELGAGFVTNPAGAGVGPYEAKSFTPSEEIVLTAKKDYWGGPVCVEELRFIPMPSDSGKYEAMRAGELQAAWLRDSLVIDQTDQDDVGGITTFQNAGNVLLLNAGVRGSTPPTKDVRVRQAIAHAIDVDAVDARATEGTGSATAAILGEKSPFYDGAEGPAYDRKKATALLDEAKAEGYNGALNVVCGKDKEEQGLAVEAQLEAAGFDVTLDTVPDSGALVDRVIVKANFEVSCWGLNVLDEALWSQLTNSLATTSKSNYGGYSDPNVDAALAELRVASTEDEVNEVMSDLQKAWNETVPAHILNASPNRTIHVDGLRNLKATSNSLVFFADAYLD